MSSEDEKGWRDSLFDGEIKNWKGNGFPKFLCSVLTPDGRRIFGFISVDRSMVGHGDLRIPIRGEDWKVYLLLAEANAKKGVKGWESFGYQIGKRIESFEFSTSGAGGNWDIHIHSSSYRSRNNDELNSDEKAYMNSLNRFLENFRKCLGNSGWDVYPLETSKLYNLR